MKKTYKALLCGAAAVAAVGIAYAMDERFFEKAKDKLTVFKCRANSKIMEQALPLTDAMFPGPKVVSGADSAKKILDEAGYKDVDGDGFVETPDGDPLVLDFVIYTSRAELGVYAQAAQASLKEIGINVNLNTVSYETLLDMRDSGQYDLLIWNVLVANTGDPENYLRENWYSKSANNTAGYNNPEVDELLDELAGTFDEEERKDLIIKIQQDIMDDAATVFFGYETTYLFSNKRVTGVKMYPMDYYWLTKDITLAE